MIIGISVVTIFNDISNNKLVNLVILNVLNFS